MMKFEDGITISLVIVLTADINDAVATLTIIVLLADEKRKSLFQPHVCAHHFLVWNKAVL